MSKGFGKVFGDDDAGVMTTSSTPTGYGSLSPEAQKTYTDALNAAGGLTAQNFAPAATTTEQMQAANYFGTPVSGISPEQFQSGISTFSNPFEEQVLQNAIRDLNTQAQGGYRDIASIASDAGGFGSNRRGLLESELQKNLLQTVGDVSATSRAGNFENAANRTLSEIARVDTMNQQNAGSLFDIGTQFQAANTATQNAPAQLQQYLADLSAMLAGGGGATYAPTAPDAGWLGRFNKGVYETAATAEQIGKGYGIGAGTNPGGVSAIGSSAGNVAGGMAAMSDKRLKENITYVGEENGHNIYSFNYLNQPTKWIGVMAQEIQSSHPDAVIENDGYLMVNYGKLGIRMRAA